MNKVQGVPESASVSLGAAAQGGLGSDVDSCTAGLKILARRRISNLLVIFGGTFAGFSMFTLAVDTTRTVRRDRSEKVPLTRSNSPFLRVLGRGERDIIRRRRRR